MGRFRTLARPDVEAILTAFGAPGYRSHRALDAGTINTNLRVETAAASLFLRVNEGKTPRDVAREAAIVAHAARRGVPTPAPLVAPGGRPYTRWSRQIVSLFPWVAGRVLSRAEVTPDHARQVGQALAHLHNGSRGFPGRWTSRYEPAEIARRVRAVARARRPELRDVVEELNAELGALQKERAARLPMGLIHGDLFIDNVLFDPASGRIEALLDFEQASWGRLAYDLAVCVLAFGFGADDFRPDVTRALIEAYADVRPPTASERRGVGAELRFAACRFTITRLTDVHLRRAPGAPSGKDYRRYLARLHSVKQHLASGDGLLAV